MCTVIVLSCLLLIWVNKLAVFVILESDGGEHVYTWIMEDVADHSKTCHCSRGSAVSPVFCSLCPTLLRAGTSVSVVEHVNTCQKVFSYILH